MRHKKPYKHKKSDKVVDAEQRQLEEQEDKRIQAGADKITSVSTVIMVLIACFCVTQCKQHGWLWMFGD